MTGIENVAMVELTNGRHLSYSQGVRDYSIFPSPTDGYVMLIEVNGIPFEEVICGRLTRTTIAIAKEVAPLDLWEVYNPISQTSVPLMSGMTAHLFATGLGK